ncbi:MAG: AAA family ATPase [Acidobacteriota bacterium]
MYLSKIRVRNYKSFRDSGDIEFKPGINIVVGQNNSGKTSLLEALGFKFEYNPHKSINLSSNNSFFNQSNLIEYAVFFSPVELSKSHIPYLPYPINGVLNTATEAFNLILEKGLNVYFSTDGKEVSSKSLSYKLYEEQVGKVLRITKNTLGYYSPDSSGSHLNNGTDHLFNWREIKEIVEGTYRFNAERLNLGKCLHGKHRILNTNASNLAEVLQNTYLENFDLYEEFINYVRLVIPSIKWVDSINVEEKPNNILQTTISKFQEIRIWRVEKSSRNEDSTVLLSESGTGISQILAILYVVVTSEKPRTIIIDEPNSFLHPSASKKLIQILNKFPQHQYFISTHSPEILSTAKASTITMLKCEDGETKVESINPTQTNDLRKTLDEIGVRFSDVFFAENILWVEGPTEEKAFPLILEKAGKILDVTILPLVHTDDFREKKKAGKHAKLAFEIYKRLSEGNALTPPFVAVILDKEDAGEQELKELEKLGEGKLKFIPQRMYENYLIDFPAITEVLNEEILEESEKVSVKQVEEWVEEKRQAMFLSKKDTGKEVLDFTDWLKQFHAAELLESLFSELSNKTVEYRKTTHSVELTKWLLENKPEQLKELQDFLVSIIEVG